MKKLLSILLALILVFSLSACGGNTENPSGDSPGISQVSETNNNESKGAELFDITDTEINVTASDYRTNLTGDEAAAQKAKIPTEVRKAVGEVVAGLCAMTPDYSGIGTFKFGATFNVPKDSYDEYWKVLTDYYKSLGGTVTKDKKVSSTDMLEIEFSWGTLYQCEGSEDLSEIKVAFKINASSDNSGDANSADQWKNATYSAYTGGVAEPAFNYTIKGVIMDQLTINAEATVDEVNAWKQSLLAAGFEEYREGEQWGISNETHNIQMNGFVNGVAYIYISLQG